MTADGARQPDLELDPEASAELDRLLSQPSDPAATRALLARAKQALRRRRQSMSGTGNGDQPKCKHNNAPGCSQCAEEAETAEIARQVAESLRRLADQLPDDENK